MILAALLLALQAPSPIQAPAAADLSSGPVAIDPQTWVRRDFVMHGIVDERADAVKVDVAVDPSGKPYRCDIIDPGLVPAFAQGACSTILFRGRFTPARDRDGGPLYGQIAMQFERHLVAKPIAPPYRPDLVVGVDRLPGGRAWALLRVRQIVAADGGFESCALDHGSEIAAIDALGCASARQLARIGAIKDRNGVPVRGVRIFTIAFYAAPASPSK